MEINKIYHLNFLENTLPDKCANLIIADPPYFEVKGSFDFIWKSFDDYLKDVEKWAIECKRILADNGTLFWWGDKKKIAYSQIILDKYFNLENSIVWRKIDSIQYQYYSTDLARTFNTHNERLLMYSNEYDVNALGEIYDDPNNFTEIKEYLRSEKQKSKLTSKQLNYMFSRYTNKDGCLDRSVMEHYWQKSQWVFPTQEIYENIMQPTGFWQKPYEELRKEYEELRKEYEDLRKEYEDQRRYFQNDLKLEEVFEFSQQSSITKNFDHDTKKPETLTRALILTCSRPNDLVVVPFSGSGTECAMAAKENRNFIGFDIEKKYVEMGNKRCVEHLRTQSLF